MTQLQRTAKLPFGFERTFRADAAIGSATVMGAEWSPHLPDGGMFRTARGRTRFLDAYTQARDSFIRDVATMIGGTVLVADTVDGKGVECSVIEPATKH